MADNTFYSSYQYLPKNTIGIESNIPEVMSTLEENILDFTANFSSGDFYKDELLKIAKELESSAYYFGQKQGLSTDKDGNKINLLDGIRANVFGHQIEFKNIAIDKYGRFYAGHVEYGHYSKNRKSYVPARPFMRPALYAVSKASQGELGEVLADLMGGIFNRGRKQQGYQGVQKLTFDTFLGAQYHKSAPSTIVRDALEAKGGISKKNLSKVSNNLSLERGKGGYYQGRIRERDANLRHDGTNLKRAPLPEKKVNKSNKIGNSKGSTVKRFREIKGSPLSSRKNQRKAKKRQYKRKKDNSANKRPKLFNTKGPFVDEHGLTYVITNGKRIYI